MRKIILFVCLVFFTPLFAESAKNSEAYQPKDFQYLLTMPGWSEALLKMHFQLYQGYVKNFNLLQKELKTCPCQTEAEIYAYGALQRRLGWEFNGMRLHELYFENLGGKKPLDPASAFYQKIVSSFGSFENWKRDFQRIGKMRGIGWVVLMQDGQTGKWINTWIDGHDLGPLATATPLLVMDVWEHAYITQYGLDRSQYIDAFFANIDWEKVSQRWQLAGKPTTAW